MIYKFIYSIIISFFLMLILTDFENVYASPNTDTYTFSIKDKNYEQFKNYVMINQYIIKYEIPEIKVIQLELTDKQYEKVKKNRLISNPKLTEPQADTNI
ncbi:hypothetical protein BU595_13070, partial [Staphylococcus arlettae]